MSTSPAWLADIMIDGSPIRVASREIDATIDGETHHYDSGLLLPRILLHETTHNRDLRIFVDNFAVGFEQIAQGSLFIGTDCMLRWYNPQGRTIVVFRGNSVRVSFSKIGRVELQLRRSLTLPLVLPARLAISALTHPIAEADVLKTQQDEGAEPYPLTVGVTNLTNDAFWLGTFFAPVASYDESGSSGNGTIDVVIAGHPIGATTVDIVVEGALEVGGRVVFPDTAVVLVEDNLGQPITMVRELGSTTNPQFFKNNDIPVVHFSFSDGDGGIVSTISDGVAQGAGDVILTLLDTYQPDQAIIDRDDFYLHRHKFNLYNVSFQVINQRALNTVFDDILKLVPHLSVPTDKGKSYRYIDFYATRADAVYHLTEGVDEVSRQGGVTYAKQTIINALHITYGRALGGAKSERLKAPSVNEVYYSSEVSDAEGHPVASSPRAIPAGSGPVALSRAVYGRREATLDIPISFDINTIDQVARDTFKQRAFPQRRLVYRVSEDLDTLTPGDIVTVTDEKLFMVKEPFVVWDVELNPTGNLLSLLSVNGRPTPQLAVA